MKSKKSLLLLGLYLLVFSVIGQTDRIRRSKIIEERDGKEYFIHTVQSGQTTYSIAKAYRVSLDDIYEANPTSRNGLSIGQQLWIPTISKEVEVSRAVSKSKFDYFYHIAKKGERFRNLASIYNVPEKYIRLANNYIREPLKAGEYVKIPSESAYSVLDGKPQSVTGSSTVTSVKPAGTQDNTSFDPNVKVLSQRHVVAAGESLEDIAGVYHIKVSDLKKVNPGLNTITTGDRLRLPVYAVLSDSPRKGIFITNQTPNNKHPQTEKTKSSLYYRYTVRQGDNVYNVARKFGVTLDKLFEVNPKLKSPNLVRGTILLIPKLKTRQQYINYKVQNKTKSRKIAKLFGISKKQLKKANFGLKNRVYAGQIIKIPGGEEAVLLSAEPELEKEKASDVSANRPETTICKPLSYRGKKYKVALMIPLFLDEFDEINTATFHKTYHPNARPFRFIEFLEGAYIALDSLKDMGYNIEVNVYDVDNQITKTTKILQQSELKSMDLIIGPFYSKSFRQVAFFAEKFDIPVINPLTIRDEILYEHKNIIKVKPGTASQIPLLTELIKRRYSNHKVFLITQNSYKNADEVTKIRTALSNAIPANISISNVAINNVSIEVDNRLNEDDEPASPYYSIEGKPIDPATVEANLYDSTVFNNRLVSVNFMVDTINPVLEKASVVRKNLVIVYGNNKSYLMDVINKLNVVRDTFNVEVIGMPLWEYIKNPDYNILNNLNLTYFTSRYINYEKPETKQFVSKFKKEYFTEPNNYGFNGFDITLYFVKMLADYDKHFLQCLPEKSALTLENGFKFDHAGDKDKNNFENTMWNIIQIKDLKTIRLQESDFVPLK